MSVISPNSIRALFAKAADGQLPQIIFGLMYTTGYFLMLFGIMLEILVLPERQSLFSGVVGVLTAAQGQVLNYFFGSTLRPRPPNETTTP